MFEEFELIGLFHNICLQNHEIFNVGFLCGQIIFDPM